MNNSCLFRNPSLFLLVLLTFFFMSCETMAEVGTWSREATLLTPLRKLEIPATDSKKIVVISGVDLDVTVEGRKLPGIEEEGVMYPAELFWAPDSSAFFITASDGGAVGTWFVSVYVIEKGRVRYLNVTQEVIMQFKKYYKCDEPEEPNVGAIRWLKGSKNLLLVAEVPPHSTCPEMGRVRGYIVEIPNGKILQEFDEKELRAQWGSHLGRRFIREKNGTVLLNEKSNATKQSTS